MYHIPIIHPYRKMRMDNIQELSEEDIKLRYITPSVIEKGWSVEDITMETKVKLTDGKINLRGGILLHVRKLNMLTMFYITTELPPLL